MKTNLAVVEDLEIGFGRVVQKRKGSDYELLQLNASHLMGIVVVNDVKDLQALDITILPTKVVYVKKASMIYKYNENTRSWEVEEGNFLIVKNELELPQLPSKYDLAYNLANNLFYIKGATGWVAYTNSIFVIEDTDSFDNIPTGIDMVIIKGTAQIFHKVNGNWQEISIETLGDPVSIVDTIEDLQANPTIKICFVKDQLRGGIFLYDQNKVQENDRGIVFNGWVRQYKGAVNATWFGAVTNDEVDNTQAFQMAFAHNEVYIPAGKYRILNEISITKDVKIYSDRAELIFSEKGCISVGVAQVQQGIKVGKLDKGTILVNAGNFNIQNPHGTLEITDAAVDFGVNKINRQFVNIIEVSPTLIFSPPIHNDMSLATIDEVRLVEFSLFNTIITSETTTTPLKFTYCKDINLYNCTIITQAKEAVSIVSCFGVVVDKVQISATAATTSTAILVKQSDDVVIKNSTLFGITNGVLLGGASIITNNLTIDKCSIQANNAIDNTSGVYNFAIKDSNILGTVHANGYNFTITDSVVQSADACVKLFNLAGGDAIFKRCSFIGMSTSMLNLFITHSTTNTLQTTLLKAPINYVLEDCTFDDRYGRYLGCIEAISLPSTATTFSIKSSFSAKNIKYQGSKASFIQAIRFSGPFLNVKLTNLDIEPICSVKQVYTHNQQVFTNTREKYFNCDNFYCDKIFKTRAQYGTNISDKKTSSMQNGYRLLCDHANIIFSDCAIHGKNLTLVQNNENATMPGTITEKCVDNKLMVEVYLGNTNGVPQNQTVNNVYLAISKPLVLFDSKINAGVV